VRSCAGEDINLNGFFRSHWNERYNFNGLLFLLSVVSLFFPKKETCLSFALPCWGSTCGACQQHLCCESPWHLVFCISLKMLWWACQHHLCSVNPHMSMFLSFAFPWRCCGELANIISVLWIPTCSCVLLLIPLSRFFSCCCCLRCSIPWDLPCFFHASKNSAEFHLTLNSSMEQINLCL